MGYHYHTQLSAQIGSTGVAMMETKWNEKSKPDISMGQPNCLPMSSTSIGYVRGPYAIGRSERQKLVFAFSCWLSSALTMT